MSRLVFPFAFMLLTAGWVSLQTFAADGSPVSLKDLVGDYYFGDGTGVNCSLTLTKHGTFCRMVQTKLQSGTMDKNFSTGPRENGRMGRPKQ